MNKSNNVLMMVSKEFVQEALLERGTLDGGYILVLDDENTNHIVRCDDAPTKEDADNVLYFMNEIEESVGKPLLISTIGSKYTAGTEWVVVQAKDLDTDEVETVVYEVIRNHTLGTIDLLKTEVSVEDGALG